MLLRKNISKNTCSVNFPNKSSFFFFLIGYIINRGGVIMFGNKYRRTLRQISHANDMTDVMKVAAAGFIAYQAAKYVIREVMD